MAQPLGTAIYALKKLPSVLDKDVAIVGQGPMGQLFGRAAEHGGPRDHRDRTVGIAAQQQSADGGDGDDLQSQGGSDRGRHPASPRGGWPRS